MPIYENACRYCIRYMGARTCTAFPDEIPVEIWEGRDNHRAPVPGDHGLLFKPLVETEVKQQGRWVTINDNPVFVEGPAQGAGVGPVTTGYVDPLTALYEDPFGTVTIPEGVTAWEVHGDVDEVTLDYLNGEWRKIPEWARAMVDKVEILERSGEGFEAGGQRFGRGAEWEQSTKTIRVFNADGWSQRLSEPFSHEVGHAIDDQWAEDIYREHELLMRRYRHWLDEDYEPLPEFAVQHRRKFPMVTAFQLWDRAWRLGEDGITDYSKAWAAEGITPGSKETFAELAKYYFRGGQGWVRYRCEEHGAERLGEAFMQVIRHYSGGDVK